MPFPFLIIYIRLLSHGANSFVLLPWTMSVKIWLLLTFSIKPFVFFIQKPSAINFFIVFCEQNT